MSNAAVIAIETPRASLARVESFPVPGRATSYHGVVTQRALVISAALHLALAAAAFAATLWPSAPVTQATVQTFDVSLVPLSALDTVAPSGSPTQTQPAPEPPAPLQQEKSLRLDSKTPLKAAQVNKPKKTVITESRAPAVSQPQESPPQQQTTSALSAATTSSAAAHVGAGSQTQSSNPARISYQDMVATKLARAKRYPERALRRQTTGDGTIRIKIDASGDVTDFEIVESTSSPILDEELREMVERAAPFPPFPADLGRASLALVVPVSFRLQQ